MENVPKIIKHALAINKWEGSNPILNNPGNMKYSDFTAEYGATQGHTATDGGSIAQFPTFTDGFVCLVDFLRLGYKNQLLAFHQARTFEAFTNVYAGNPPLGYIEGIAALIPCGLQDDISTFLVL